MTSLISVISVTCTMCARFNPFVVRYNRIQQSVCQALPPLGPLHAAAGLCEQVRQNGVVWNTLMLIACKCM